MHLDPSQLRITSYRGGIALTGDALLSAFTHFCPGKTAPSHPLHISLLTASELKSLPNTTLASVDVPLNRVYVLGQDSRKAVQWLVVVWNHADVYRRTLGLTSKEYHMTLSDQDDHDIPKGVRTLLHSMGRADFVDREKDLGEDGMDHVVLALQGTTEFIHLAEDFVLSFPNSYKAYVRLADAYPNTKLSALALARAASLNLALLPSVLSRLRKLRQTISWGPVATASELSLIPENLRPLLLQPCSENLAEMVLWKAPTLSRDRQLYLGTHELPRFFSWVYPNRVAGMSTPRRKEDINLLRLIGFTHVLTLTEEEPLDESWFTHGIKHTFIPLVNYGAPTLEEMDCIYRSIKSGGVWLIHCGGGVGRAGTILACLIAMFGKDSDENDDGTPQLDANTAVSLLRHARPRSLESEKQEKFAASWVSHRWKIAHSYALLSEPVTPLRHEGERRFPSGTTFFLIGKPGSGKSWLSSAILKRRPKDKTIIISLDENGSRVACERDLARNYPDDTMIIFDRCNPQSLDRQDWLKLTDRPCVAVYFDYSKELCQQRINNRFDHPTIRAGRGQNALDQFDKQMESPTLQEGFISIFTITSFAASRDAVRLIAGDPPLLKFPRTAHLLDLGAKSSDDIVLETFDGLTGELTVEEKIDGANMGISLDWTEVIPVQNRSHWVSSADHAQFRSLDTWIKANEAGLRKVLEVDPQFPERYILYGEWMVAKHSIHYTSLPAPFIAFDLYDRLTYSFLSRSALSSILKSTGIHQVPLIAESNHITKSDLLRWVKQDSKFTNGTVEGVYVRIEDAQREKTIGRGKVVRGDFIAGNEHWARGIMVKNRIAEYG